MIADSSEYAELTSRPARRKLFVPAPKEDTTPPPPDAPVVNVTVPVPQVVVEYKGEPFPDKLVFDILRDSEGRMKQVIMRRPK